MHQKSLGTTGLGLACSSHNANNKLLTACQHWNHDSTCPLHRHHSQLRKSCISNLSC